MSDETEQTQPAAPKPKQKRKRKPARKAAPRAKAPQPEAKVEYPGLSGNDCASGCNVQGCLISKEPYCAHPFKGGLHPHQISDAEALKRLNLAKKQLGADANDKRFT